MNIDEALEEIRNTESSWEKFIYNATPHNLTLWEEGWDEVVTIKPQKIINAKIVNKVVKKDIGTTYVTPSFEPTEEGMSIIEEAKKKGYKYIVGSGIAAQAYPGEVVIPVMCEGYERGNDRRCYPNIFVIYNE